MGFKCPQRKNVADFLQEVVSKKDQEQYWAVPDRTYRYIPVVKFAEAFRLFHTGKNLCEELNVPFDRRYNHPAALSSSRYGMKKRELLKTSFNWQLLLMKRNSFIYVFKFIQLLFVASITMTVFFRTTMHHNTIDDGGLYLGALYFAMVIMLFNGFTEVSMLVAKLPVIYKHRDLHFYPCWAYTLPSWLLSIPTSLIESGFWVIVTYYVIGFDPNFTRCLSQFLIYFFLHQMSLALFRVMGSLGRSMIVANTFGSFAMLVVMGLGGYVISRDSISSGWIWGFWISPLMYAQNAASVNEFLGHSWDKRAGNHTNLSLGKALLKARSLFPQSYWYWIGVGALLGYTVLFNILFTIFLTYLNPLGKRQAVVSEEELQERDKRKKGGEPVVIQLRQFLEHSGSLKGKCFEQRGMVLPFQPLSMSFSNINYYVDVPLELKQQGVLEDRLQLLVNITGAFRPGVLTALVGLLFMKRGGEVIYAGPLGPKSCKLIEYFEAVEGMPKIRPGYNPAAWMLDVTSSAEENRLGVDFAEVYRRSNLFQRNKELVEILSKPNRESKDLNFPTKYSQAYADQFLACLWKQNLSYWRNPQYTAVRFFYTVIISLMLGTICWRFGSKRDTQQEIFNAMGSMYAAVLFIGVTNGTAVQPVVSVERFVSYRERAAGMYSALPFAFAQVAIEFPYVLAQTLIYCTIFYCMASFEWNAWKFICLAHLDESKPKPVGAHMECPCESETLELSRILGGLSLESRSSLGRNSGVHGSTQNKFLIAPGCFSLRDEAPTSNQARNGHQTCLHAPPDHRSILLLFGRSKMAEHSLGSMIMHSATNYAMWKPRMEDILFCKDLHDPLENKGDKPVATKDEEWKKMNRKTIGLIRYCIGHEVFHHVAQETSAYELWIKLEEMYQAKTTRNKALLMRRLGNLKLQRGTTVAEYTSEFQNLVNQLNNVDLQFDDEMQALLLLSSLSESWETLMVSLSNSVPNGKLTTSMVMDALFNEEARRRERGKTYQNESQGLVSEESREKGRGQGKGHHRGHIKRDCPKYKAQDQSSEIAATIVMVEDEDESDVLLSISTDEKSNGISKKNGQGKQLLHRGTQSKHRGTWRIRNGTWRILSGTRAQGDALRYVRKFGQTRVVQPMQDVQREPQRKETKSILRSCTTTGPPPLKRVSFTLDLISGGDFSICAHKGGEIKPRQFAKYLGCCLVDLMGELDQSCQDGQLEDIKLSSNGLEGEIVEVQPIWSIPIWWRWYYWANPVAWSLYGLLASQYGDSNKLVKLSDGVKSMPIRLLVKDVFGFRHDFVGVAAFMVVTFCMMFALIFAYGIKSFNFQKR
ncbi:pleiotropic drug resistance 4 [Actinidia rufa]|uniref:Pleiotropic drug resistance 4 n=1 Tax=Actinidia rufa TaxID=165716 RepID=A0A7J0E5J6_9ERIC|nr:pleiotropic drug resistance 4 [Actinidia rufa]